MENQFHHMISKMQCNLIYYYVNYYYVLKIIDTWITIFVSKKRMDKSMTYYIICTTV